MEDNFDGGGGDRPGNSLFITGDGSLPLMYTARRMQTHRTFPSRWQRKLLAGVCMCQAQNVIKMRYNFCIVYTFNNDKNVHRLGPFGRDRRLGVVDLLGLHSGRRLWCVRCCVRIDYANHANNCIDSTNVCVRRHPPNPPIKLVSISAASSSQTTSRMQLCAPLYAE